MKYYRPYNLDDDLYRVWLSLAENHIPAFIRKDEIDGLRKQYRAVVNYGA